MGDNRLLKLWKWIDATKRLSTEQAAAELVDMVKGLRQYGVQGGPVAIGDEDVEAVLISAHRHELLIDLLERHGAIVELEAAERDATSTWEAIQQVAADLGVDARREARGRAVHGRDNRAVAVEGRL
ncbi:MAG: hypothetical protein ACR2LV_05025 [Solirubrobacteraceae bacterium]